MSGFDCTSVHDVNFDAEKVRFSHQLINRNFGPSYQRSLLNATLAVFGLDEISTRMLEAVSSAGVGHVLLIDSTTVQPWDSNVNVVAELPFGPTAGDVRHHLLERYACGAGFDRKEVRCRFL